MVDLDRIINPNPNVITIFLLLNPDVPVKISHPLSSLQPGPKICPWAEWINARSLPTSLSPHISGCRRREILSCKLKELDGRELLSSSHSLSNIVVPLRVLGALVGERRDLDCWGSSCEMLAWCTSQWVISHLAEKNDHLSWFWLLGRQSKWFRS